MTRTLLALALGVVLGAAGVVLAGRFEPKPAGPTVTKLAEEHIAETIDGEPAKVVVVEVAHGPGAVGSPHRHPGPVFGYVLEGEYELNLGDQPTRSLKAGDTFYEPTGILHGASRNPSDKNPTRLLAVMLMSRDVTELSKPATDEKPSAQP